MDPAGVVVVVVFLLLIVAVIAYRVGYVWAQVESLNQDRRLEAKWRMSPMATSVPRWRLVAGWVAYLVATLLLCLFLVLAYWQASTWGWTYLMGLWTLWFAGFLGVMWLAEWCWKPSREPPDTTPGEEGPT